ncbi:hypothetical protein BWQ96_09064 [Gracilariopsis chorda]|uniref:Uncharacterized protein n=1 Tax=Gracilariopsis chorda TaxID=448386 RepID=A0A2V3IGK9_9FLOR|nr:hypothetical protein BWQ96_09064 [Gracilariopsis chorda]|eukprot:PXF41209.1 hypothetical protein BWQ96_09064 [Gracilariopsis chorda]
MTYRTSKLLALILLPLLTLLIPAQAAVLNTHNLQLQLNRLTQLSPTARLVKGEEPSPTAKSVLRQNPTTETPFDQLILSFTSSDTSENELLSEQLEPSPEHHDVSIQISPPLTDPPTVVITTDDHVPPESQPTQAQAIPPRTNATNPASTNNTTPDSDGVVFQLSAPDNLSEPDTSPEGNDIVITALNNETSPQSAQQNDDDFARLTVSDAEQDEPQPSPLPEQSQPSIFAALPSLAFDDDAFMSSDGSEGDFIYASPMPTDEPQFSPAFAPSMTVDSESSATSRVEITLSVTSSAVSSVSEAFDNESRIYFADVTNTDPDDWKLVFISAAKEVKERETTRVQWGVQYQGILPSEDLNDTVQNAQDDIAEGGLESHLRAALPSVEDVTVQLSDPIKVNVEDRAAASVQGLGAVNSGVSNENAATGGNPEGLSSANSTDNSSPTRSKNLGVILGTCLGLLAVVVLSVAVFVFARGRAHSPRHTIDGEEVAPPTLTSIQSMSTDTTTSRFHTGAPVNPRGVTVLRNQSRLLDWRMNQAATAGRTHGTPMGHTLPEVQE